MSHTIFRKSTNTNSFGLRGYWSYNPSTFELHSFASSHDFSIGQTLSNHHGCELLRLEGTVQPSKRKDFLQTVTLSISKASE